MLTSRRGERGTLSLPSPTCGRGVGGEGVSGLNDPAMQTDTYFLEKALDLAKHARSLHEVPVGAVVVQNGEIIGKGWNHSIGRCDPTAHAEILALREAAQYTGNYRLLQCTLYTTLEPCSMCAGALIHSRIERLVFGAFDLKSGAVGSVFNLLESNGINHRIAVSSGILQKDCGEMLTNFFRERRHYCPGKV
jgi:tRNA(adenine34) deaminase